MKMPSMKAWARIGIFFLTAMATGLLGGVQGVEFVSVITEIIPDPFIAATVASLVAWLVGSLVGKIPKSDPPA
jgi:hypothetical protein